MRSPTGGDKKKLGGRMPEGVLDGARKGRDATRLDAKHAQIARRAASGRCRYALIFSYVECFSVSKAY